MNENINRVQAAFTDDDFQEIIQTINQLDTLLTPYRIGLSPEERVAMPKINVDNKTFVEDATTEIQNPTAAQFMPPYFKPSDMVSDLKMYQQNEVIASRLNNLFQISDDLRVVAGSEAFTSALAFKRMADQAAKIGIPGAGPISDKLKERFSGQGPRPSTPTDI